MNYYLNEEKPKSSHWKTHSLKEYIAYAVLAALMVLLYIFASGKCAASQNKAADTEKPTQLELTSAHLRTLNYIKSNSHFLTSDTLMTYNYSDLVQIDHYIGDFIRISANDTYNGLGLYNFKISDLRRYLRLASNSEELKVKQFYYTYLSFLAPMSDNALSLALESSIILQEQLFDLILYILSNRYPTIPISDGDFSVNPSLLRLYIYGI